MKRITLLAAVVVAGACTTPSRDASQEALSMSPMEGTFEYVGTLKGQSVLTGGRFVFLYGLADGSAPMTGEAGTYQISRDTATHTITYSTDAARIGLVFKWTPESTLGDTLSYVVMSAAGEVTARGRSVRRR